MAARASFGHHRRRLRLSRPDEVYALTIAIAGTWSPVSGTFTASQEDSEPDHDRRRAALREVIERALMP